MRSVHTILSGLPVLTVLSIAPIASVHAQAMTLGEAANYTLLGLNNGVVGIDAGSTAFGDFGYCAGVVSTTNKGLGWTGTAYVHSGVANFTHDPTYVPTRASAGSTASWGGNPKRGNSSSVSRNAFHAAM